MISFPYYKKLYYMAKKSISKSYLFIIDKLIFSVGLLFFALFLGTNNSIRSGDTSRVDFCVVFTVSLAVIGLFIAIWEYRSFKKKEVTNAVYVLICDKPLWLDTENLKDDLLCTKDNCGAYQSSVGEQYFTHMNAPIIARKQGKRLLTDGEYNFITELPCRWDYYKKGFWISFDLVLGGTTEVFFSAAGYRNPTGELLDVISTGYYWSDYNKGLSGHYFHFNSTIVNARNVGSHEYGFSVRCVSRLFPFPYYK